MQRPALGQYSISAVGQYSVGANNLRNRNIDTAALVRPRKNFHFPKESFHMDAKV
jgi:hypothetical protein